MKILTTYYKDTPNVFLATYYKNLVNWKFSLKTWTIWVILIMKLFSYRSKSHS